MGFRALSVALENFAHTLADLTAGSGALNVELAAMGRIGAARRIGAGRSYTLQISQESIRFLRGLAESEHVTASALRAREGVATARRQAVEQYRPPRSSHN